MSTKEMNGEWMETTGLLAWYDAHRRILPWREKPEPYRIWVSEIMLQQTRVDTVKGYFYRFFEKFPTIEDLANCQDEELLKIWEGLGYYSRARNLKKAAGVIIEQYGGRMPSSREALKDLPGIGPYTAGAIASIAFGQSAAAVDGNVLRIVARITGDREDIQRQSMKKKVENYILTTMEKMTGEQRRPGDFNQALMDVGATICLPHGQPHCDQCPLLDQCRSYRENLTGEIPVKVKKVKKVREKKTVLVVVEDRQMAVEKRGEKGLLAGLYQLPNLEGHGGVGAVETWAKDRNLKIQNIREIGQYRHIFSHKTWEMEGYLVQVIRPETEELPSLIKDSLKDDLKEGFPKEESGEGKLLWVNPEERETHIPLPTAFKGFADFFPEK